MFNSNKNSFHILVFILLLTTSELPYGSRSGETNLKIQTCRDVINFERLFYFFLNEIIEEVLFWIYQSLINYDS